MQKQGLNAVQSLPNGYDPDFVSKNAGAARRRARRRAVPSFEHQPQIPEMQTMMKWAQNIKVKPVGARNLSGGSTPTSSTPGLKMAGPNFTQQKVIDSLNTLTAYDDNGLIQPIDWTKQHEDPLTHPAVSRAERLRELREGRRTGSSLPIWRSAGQAVRVLRPQTTRTSTIRSTPVASRDSAHECSGL